MMYLVTVGTETWTDPKDGPVYTGSVQSPTFLLDGDIQGIVSADHAERIVRRWLSDAGLTVLYVSVSVALVSSVA